MSAGKAVPRTAVADTPGPVRQVFRGAAELRDLVAMAWKDSDNALVGYPGVKITDLEIGGAAAFKSFNE